MFTGASFEREVNQYLQRGLRKGVPPLFVDLRSLYKEKAKADIIQQLLEQYVEELSKTGHFCKYGKSSINH